MTTFYLDNLHSNDDEVAALLSHELAHVVAYHVAEERAIKDYNWSASVVSWLSLLAPTYSDAIISVVPRVVFWLALPSYYRLREREADHIGLFLMTDAGFDPAGKARLRKKVEKWELETGN